MCKKKNNKNTGGAEEMSSAVAEKLPVTPIVERYCSPAESLEQSLKEVNLMRSGKMKKRTWDDFLKELEEEDN